MLTHPIFLAGFSLLTLIGFIHTSATTLLWYWQYPWMDIAVHFLAGLIVGFFALWLIMRVFGTEHLVWRVGSLYFTLAAVVVVGVVWEVFEYMVGIPRGTNYQFDTSLDMLMNVLGSIIAVFISRKFFI